jgi:hypothetical protein
MSFKKTLRPCLLSLLLLLAMGSLAQPYSGGPGDGYARALISGGAASASGESLRPLLYPLPAPAGGWLHIALPLPGVAYATLCTPQGQALGEAARLEPGGSSRLRLPELPEGLYFLRLQQGARLHWEKIWVQAGR